MSDSARNFNLPLLYQAAERFNFIVDTRGIYPTMIRGQKAARYETHRDMLNFISVAQMNPDTEMIRITQRVKEIRFGVSR